VKIERSDESCQIRKKRLVFAVLERLERIGLPDIQDKEISMKSSHRYNTMYGDERHFRKEINCQATGLKRQ
jgi:hypothetical protein